MKRRIISLLLVCVMFITCTFVGEIPAFAAETSPVSVWKGDVDTSWFTNDKDTYNITTAAQLAGFAQLTCDAAHSDRFRGVTINLMTDVVLNDTTYFSRWNEDDYAPRYTWTPIGRVGGPISGYRPFAGMFNGNGHTIHGMYVDTGEPGGFFAYGSGAFIGNLRFEKCYVKSLQPSGILLGSSEGCFIQNIEVLDSFVRTTDDRWAAAGGIVGVAETTNSIPEVSYALLAATGVIVNPILWFGADFERVPVGTNIVNCRVINTDIISSPKWYLNSAGGILGEGRDPFGIYSCYTADCRFAAIKGGNYKNAGNAGGIVGLARTRGGQTPDHYIRRCYSYNFQRIDAGTARSDEADVPAISSAEIKSAAFVTKLNHDYSQSPNGSPLNYKYVDGDYPAITSIIPKQYPFRDVAMGQYYDAAVTYLYKNNIMKGKNYNTFGVDSNLKRQDMIVLLWNAEGCPDYSNIRLSFTDVKKNSYYENAIKWAYKVGITTGKNATTFGVDEPIRRQDFVVMLYRYSIYKHYNVKVPSATAYKASPDAAQISAHAIEAVNWGYYHGFIGNKSNIKPKDYICRKDAATIIYRVLTHYNPQ